MVSFVIYCDSLYYKNKMFQLIQNTMQRNCLPFSICDIKSETEFLDLIASGLSNQKIYILGFDDIHENIRFARCIRTKDHQSQIILMPLESPSRIEEANIVASKLRISNMIEKTNAFPHKLECCISQIITENGGLDSQKVDLKNQNWHDNILRFHHKKVYYTIPIQDILMITPEKGMHQINIKTKYNVIPVPMSLKDMKVLLPEQFVYSHRSCIVNVGVIATYDEHHLHIRFINGEETDCISESCAKELLEKYIDFSGF